MVQINDLNHTQIYISGLSHALSPVIKPEASLRATHLREVVVFGAARWTTSWSVGGCGNVIGR